jgi:hypothetical protein
MLGARRCIAGDPTSEPKLTFVHPQLDLDRERLRGSAHSETPL